MFPSKSFTLALTSNKELLLKAFPTIYKHYVFVRQPYCKRNRSSRASLSEFYTAVLSITTKKMFTLFLLCVLIAASFVTAEIEENSARLLLYKVRKHLHETEL